MFLGEYQHTLDDRGRVALPKKIREELASRELVLTKGFESCIMGFQKESWGKEARKYLVSPLSETEARKIRRYLFSAAIDATIDKIGRILIPNSLKESARIKNQIVIIGAGDHFEMWDPSIWKNYLSQIGKT